MCSLVGFVLVFQSGTILPSPVAAVSTYAGFFLAAPGRAHLARDQRRLDASGCTCDLLAALRGVDG